MELHLRKGSPLAWGKCYKQNLHFKSVLFGIEEAEVILLEIPKSRSVFLGCSVRMALFQTPIICKASEGNVIKVVQ